MFPSVTLPEFFYTINNNLNNANILKIAGIAFLVVVIFAFFTVGAKFNKKPVRFGLTSFWLIALVFWLPFGIGEMWAYAKDTVSGIQTEKDLSADQRQMLRFCNVFKAQGLVDCKLADLLPYLQSMPLASKIYLEPANEIFLQQIRHQLNGRHEIVADPQLADYIVFFSPSDVNYKLVEGGQLSHDGKPLLGKYVVIKPWDGQTSLIKKQ